MADTKMTPGTEPLQKTPKGDRPTRINPNSGVPHSDTSFDQMAFNSAVASEDFGAARRLLYKDADVGIHAREGGEVANPTKDLKSLGKRAGEQIDAQIKHNERLAEEQSGQPLTGAPRKEDSDKDDAGAAMAAATTKKGSKAAS